MVFGFIATLGYYFNTKNQKALFLLAFLIVSIAFTYSRASYLSLVAGASVMFILLKKYKFILAIILTTFIIVIFLPRPSSSGVQLERLYSVFLRIENYKETIFIWKKYPLFGVGYNNICLARKAMLKDFSYHSHSCSGADSSILFILATTGVVGLMVIMGLLKEIKKVMTKSYYSTVLVSCFVALFVHSMFHNSMFYSWVIGWMMILLSLSVRITPKSAK